MFRILVFLLIVVPALEIWGIVLAGRIIGGWQTFLLIVATGVIGGYLAKREGTRVWRRAKEEMLAGGVPAQAVLDGICIFTGGLLLLTPGFITDIVGFTLVFPATRPMYRYLIGSWIGKKIASGSWRFIIRR